MTALEVVREYYFKYRENTVECAEDYLKNKSRKNPERKIKRIAIYYPVMNRGGVQRVISLLFSVFYHIHYEVILITERISDEDYYVPDWVKRFVITCESAALEDDVHFKIRYIKLAEILKTENVDLFLHHGVRHKLFVYDVMLANLMGIYTVALKHQVFTQGFCDIRDLFWVHLHAFQIIDGLVVLSSFEETYWRTFGINAFYIENPFNEELKVIDDKKLKRSISWVGRLDVYSKQYFDVLKIAAIVTKAHPKVKFEMYGSGSLSKINGLNECIKKYGLDRNVSFCGYETDIMRIYENTRIQLVTSAYEGFPMVIYESKILGIPLVVYDLPYLELLRNGLGYISVPNGDIEGAAENICKILDSPELEAKLGAEAKISIRDFNNEKIGEKWAHLFEHIEKHNCVDEKNDVYSLILKTMHRHFAIAQKKYEKLLWDSEQTVISYHARKGVRNGKELVICPFGIVGKRAKKMLNEKGIWETHIVDNGLAQNHSDILTMTRLKELDCSKFFFIICCEDENLKNEFYVQLREITSEDNIVYYDAELD